MTQEEAKKLKPGDRVLVEAEVVSDSPDNENPITEIGNVQLYVKCKKYNHFQNEKWESYFLSEPEAIREKMEPPRRKFREGDIVTFDSYLREVEQFNPTAMIGLYNDGDDPEWVEADEVKLVCAVEDRTDRKGGGHE